MKSIKDIIANVLDNNESLCLDSSEDKNTLCLSLLDEGADVQVDDDGQFIVYTNVYQD